MELKLISNKDEWLNNYQGTISVCMYIYLYVWAKILIRMRIICEFYKKGIEINNCCVKWLWIYL